MTLNKRMVVFHIAEVKFLGPLIIAKEIEGDQENVKAIADLPATTSVSEVRTFLET